MLDRLDLSQPPALCDRWLSIEYCKSLACAVQTGNMPLKSWPVKDTGRSQTSLVRRVRQQDHAMRQSFLFYECDAEKIAISPNQAAPTDGDKIVERQFESIRQ